MCYPLLFQDPINGSANESVFFLTYPPYASYALLRLFIYLKKEKSTPLRARGGFDESVISHTVKPSYPKSSLSAIAAAIPAGLPKSQFPCLGIKQLLSYPPPMMTTHVVSSVSGRSASDPALDDSTLDDVMQ
jgi:hypothetical protein